MLFSGFQRGILHPCDGSTAITMPRMLPGAKTTPPILAPYFTFIRADHFRLSLITHHPTAVSYLAVLLVGRAETRAQETWLPPFFSSTCTNRPASSGQSGRSPYIWSGP